MFRRKLNCSKAPVLPGIQKGFEAFNTKINLKVEEIVILGDWAFSSSTFTHTRTPKAGGFGGLLRRQVPDDFQKAARRHLEDLPRLLQLHRPSARPTAGLHGSPEEAAGDMVREERRIEPRGSAGRFEESYQTYLQLYEVTKPLL